jgi:NTE family protein
MKTTLRLARKAAFLATFFALISIPPAQADPCGNAATQNGVSSADAVDLRGLRIGIALGSGGMHGFAHIGVIQELEAQGIRPKIVTGTSAGALMGALWASGLSGEQIETLARANDWNDFAQFSPSFRGLYVNDRLAQTLAAVFSGHPIESWPRRFGAIAVNVDNGAHRVLLRGNAARAVQASTALPLLFQPVDIDGEPLADGALVEPIPVDTARSLGADYVIAVDVAYKPYEERVAGLSAYGFQVMHILINALGAEALARADFPLRMDLHELYVTCGGEALIGAGRTAVRRAWPSLKRSLESRAAAQKSENRFPLTPPGLPR